MGYDKETFAGPRMPKMLTDLKVTNNLSSECPKSHNMPPNPIETTGRHEFSVASLVKHKSFASQYSLR